MSWLDVKLGLRMLVKHPGLTVVGVVAIAFGIAVGAVVFQVLSDLYRPSLGLPDGHRVVELEEGEDGQVLHDFVTWREELESVDDVSAYATVRGNLLIDGGGVQPVRVAEINASAFRVTRVPPLMGRTLLDADEEPGAPLPLVIGYDVWQTRFEGDPEVVGRTVRLNADPGTVVGVMPEGFAFPMAHDVWAPLRLDVNDYERGRGPALDVSGRLAPGVSLDQAQAELTVLGRRAATRFPEANARRRPVVRPYRGGLVHGSERLLVGAYGTMAVIPVLVLLLVSANVALLVFARTASRESEIVVRSALGASRGRVVLQLFVEALVLAGAAAVVGLVAADRVTGYA
ncbi:MAG TPA: ABC transporter permease, partial [Longimicrobiales bacterium]|nr:ABC transporter permease [Longimicrobiales bacterium]